MEIPEQEHHIIYLDNAATVYPKPAEVLTPMTDIFRRFGVNPGRSGYDLCLVGGQMVHDTRMELTEFFGATHPERLCWGYNASDSLNVLIQGLLDPGDHAITTVMEHNSVIRPLNHLARDNGVALDYARCNAEGYVEPDEIARLVRKDTKLVVVNHGSNVIGTIQPVTQIGKLCREKGIVMMVDVAQTAGVIPIDVEAMNIDALAFTGHKSLLGPMGIGGLWVRDGVEVRPTRFGGTGVKSAYPYHLDEYPNRLEVGTPNVLGIVGLHLAQEWIADKGLDDIYNHEMELFGKLQSGISDIEGVTIHGTRSLSNRLPVLSINVEGWDPSDVGVMLDVDHDIAVRTGLQCAPLIHDAMGTGDRGTVRFSVGPMNVQEHIDAAIAAITQIAADSPARK